MAVKNPLKLFEKDCYFLSYDRVFLSRTGELGQRRMGLINTARLLVTYRLSTTLQLCKLSPKMPMTAAYYWCTILSTPYSTIYLSTWYTLLTIMTTSLLAACPVIHTCQAYRGGHYSFFDRCKEIFTQ